MSEGRAVRVAVLGFGYWGPNLARNLAETAGFELAAICDTRPEVLKLARTRYSYAQCGTDVESILADPKIEAVAIATPVSTHAELAVKAFAHGKHVLLTKPIAGSAVEARKIIDAAKRAGRVLLVDHTFVYMGAVQKVKTLIDNGVLGALYYFDSVRVNLGLFQQDVSVLWDLAVHDLSILGAWVPGRPTAVSCIASGHVEGHPKDVAYLTLLYDDSFTAHVHVNWLSPVKIRRTLLGGSKKMIVFDDLDPVEKIKVYDRGVSQRMEPSSDARGPIAYRRTGDVWMPQFDLTEALLVETGHFLRCILEGEAPRTDGASALRIVEILEAADQSMAEQGRAVALSSSADQ